MVPYIARQSVIIKCSMKKSVLLGNYEFYYAAGLFKKLFGAELQADMPPQEILEHILKQAESISPKDEKEEYLVSLLKKYEPEDGQDEQMRLLCEWGENEKAETIWNMQRV